MSRYQCPPNPVHVVDENRAAIKVLKLNTYLLVSSFPPPPCRTPSAQAFSSFSSSAARLVPPPSPYNRVRTLQKVIISRLLEKQLIIVVAPPKNMVALWPLANAFSSFSSRSLLRLSERHVNVYKNI